MKKKCYKFEPGNEFILHGLPYPFVPHILLLSKNFQDTYLTTRNIPISNYVRISILTSWIIITQLVFK